MSSSRFMQDLIKAAAVREIERGAFQRLLTKAGLVTLLAFSNICMGAENHAPVPGTLPGTKNRISCP